MIDLSIGRVAEAYAANKGNTFPSLGGIEATKAVAGPSFDDVIKEGLVSAVKTVQAGEAASIAGIQGKMSAQQVVQAVLSAEMTVQAVVAVRDKMVQAYQDIMRMPI